MSLGPRRFVGKVYKYTIFTILELQVPFQVLLINVWNGNQCSAETHMAPEKAKHDRQTDSGLLRWRYSNKDRYLE